MKRNLYFAGVGLAGAILIGYFIFYTKIGLNKKSADLGGAPKMIRYQLNKMWRDGAAAEMEAVDGAIIHRYILSDADYKDQLNLKAREELEEVIAAKNKQERMEEIGDLYEVIDCMIARDGLDKQEIERLQTAKRQKRGSYRNGEYVTMVHVVPGSYLHNYYLRSPERHQPLID